MDKLKRFMSFIMLALVSLVYIATSEDINVVYASDAEEERIQNGLSFPNANDTYSTVKKLEVMPRTFEAYIHVPKTRTERTGIIFGNYGPDNKTACFSFEIQVDGYPKLYYDVDNIGSTNPSPLNINFIEVDVRSDSYVHLVITHDVEKKEACCYLNGELKQTIAVAEPANYNGFNYVPSKVPMIGGDYRPGNSQYFKGQIKSLECYTDVRSAEEVKADYERLLAKPEDENLLCAYNFTKSGTDYLNDLSKNNYTIDYSGDDYLEVDAIKFETESRYITTENYDTHPNTFEAEILLPRSYSTRAGVILGNWGMGASLSFEVSDSGRPRLFYTDASGNDRSIVFNADVRTGNWAHLAITHDMSNKMLYCYINGVKVAESTDCAAYNDDSIDYPFVFGGDNRLGNEQYFKGYIRSVSAFKDVRSDEEIKSDYENGIDLTDENLMLLYKTTKANEGNDFNNLANSKYNIHYQTTWFTDKKPVDKYAYSFACVGDTQILARRFPTEFSKIYDWIVANKESKNIQYVFGLGDITDANTPNEWALAKREISKLDGVVPYSLVRGNHDTSQRFNDMFYTDEYYNQFDGFYDEQFIDNSYNAFTVGDVDYLLLTLDYGASDEELEWAGSIIEQYPTHRVIITTHCYMYRDGTTLGPNDVCPPADSNDANYSPNKVYNNGDQMWDKLVSQYGNIFLVLSGHDPCENVVTRQSEGIHGNTVTQMLIDPQGMDASLGATGMVAMLYFSEDGQQMEVEFYSTVHNQFFKESNQYKIDISNTGDLAHDYQYIINDNEHWLECECGKVKEGSQGNHNFEAKFDADEHWLECECGIEVEGSRHKHTWDDGVITVKPTSTTTGKKEHSCSGCDAKYIEILEKSASTGCKGSASISLLAMFALFIGLIYIKKRKQTQ